MCSLCNNLRSANLEKRLSRRFAPLRRSHVEPLRVVLCADDGFRIVNPLVANTPVPSCMTGNLGMLFLISIQKELVEADRRILSVLLAGGAYFQHRRWVSAVPQHG